MADPETQEFVDALTARVTGGDRAGWTGVFAELKPPIPMPEPDPDGRGEYVNGSVCPLHMKAAMEALEADGRFDLLDKPLTDAERAEIAGLNAMQAGQRINALRDHFNAPFVVSSAGEHPYNDRAEQVARYLGDVTNTWVEAQVSEPLEMAGEFLKTYNKEMESLNTQQAEARAQMDAALKESDYELKGKLRGDAFRAQAEISNEKAELGKALDTFSKSIAQARAAALTNLMATTVSSYEPVPVGDIIGQKKALGKSLSEASSMFPDSWKQNTLSLSPLIVRASKARAHYCANSPVKKKSFTAYTDDTAEYATGDAPSPVAITSRRRREDVEILVGGDPNNPEHVALMEKERERLNAEDRQWISENMNRYLASRRKADPRWEVYTNPQGVLALRETFPCGMRTVGYESVIRVDDNKSTMVHELAHRMEDGNPHLRAVCEEFIRRRTTDDNGVQERPIRYFRDKEPVFKDHLTHAYIGKMYPKKHTEVLSMGMEMLMFGKYGGGYGLSPVTNTTHMTPGSEDESRVTEDQEHMNLIMGLLLSAKHTTDA